MNSYRFATTGRLGQEFKSMIDNDYPAWHCTFFDNHKTLEAQLHNFNAFAGFSIPENIDISHIQWIHSFGAGVDFFTNQQLPSGVLLTRTAGDMGLRMAEYCLAYMLHEFKSIGVVHQHQQRKEWTPLLLKGLNTANVLIFGTGNIGSAVAQILQPLVKGVDGVNRSGVHVTGYNAIFQLNESISYRYYVF